jgi:hypothetical protein
MTFSNSTTEKPSLEDPNGFSLVRGGPLYRFWRRIGLAGDAPELLGRRIVVLAALAWVPLFLLSFIEGQFWGGSVPLPFLHDFELHIRLLLAMPLLLAAEPFVHGRLQVTVRQFTDRGLVSDETRGQFDAAMTNAMRLRDSTVAELLILAFVYGVGVLFIWRSQALLHVTAWYGTPMGEHQQPSMAGWWLRCISVPMFQFLLFRWYFRLFIWARFLWQVSRINLRLLPTHPDRCAGLAFLSGVGDTFSPVAMAHGALVAGIIANRIYFNGATLLDFKPDLAGVAVVMLLMILAPLLVFSPALESARRKGVREYGSLAGRYVREFDQKWLRDKTQPSEPLIGNSDIQSLADIGTSFSVVKEMTILPFSVKTVSKVAVVTLAPVAPLLLTMIPLEELIDRVLKVLV